MVASSTKSWLLCPACATRASAILPQAGLEATHAGPGGQETPSADVSDPLVAVGKLLQEGLGPSAGAEPASASIPEALPVAEVVASPSASPSPRDGAQAPALLPLQQNP